MSWVRSIPYHSARAMGSVGTLSGSGGSISSDCDMQKTIARGHLRDKLLGLESVEMCDDGIQVFTGNPEMVPKAAERVPIIVHPATGRKIKLLSPTYNTQVRLLYEALFIG